MWVVLSVAGGGEDGLERQPGGGGGVSLVRCVVQEATHLPPALA